MVSQAHLEKNTKSVSYVDPNIDKFIPFYQNKENSFWNTNLEKNNKNKQNQLNLKENMNRVNEKISNVCRKKGWLAMRSLRNYLRSSARRERVQKINLKLFLTNFGVFLNDNEMDAIYNIYDEKVQDEITFSRFLNDLIVLSETRNQLINTFLSQFNVNNDKINLKTLEKSFSLQYHPDVIALKKTLNEIKNDFSVVLFPMKENEEISVTNFVALLRDISFSIDNDNEFINILLSCGFKQY